MDNPMHVHGVLYGAMDKDTYAFDRWYESLNMLTLGILKLDWREDVDYGRNITFDDWLYEYWTRHRHEF